VNLDYARETVNDRDIDIPLARRALLHEVASEIRPVTELRPVPGLLYGAYLQLLGTPDAAAVRKIVDDLCTVMNDRFGDVHAVGIPYTVGHPALDPDPEHPLATAAQHFGDIAAILNALDLLSWVLAYDQIQPPVFGDDEEDEDGEDEG